MDPLLVMSAVVVAAAAASPMFGNAKKRGATDAELAETRRVADQTVAEIEAELRADEAAADRPARAPSSHPASPARSDPTRA